MQFSKLLIVKTFFTVVLFIKFGDPNDQICMITFEFFIFHKLQGCLLAGAELFEDNIHVYSKLF